MYHSLYDDFPYIHNQFDKDGELHHKHKAEKPNSIMQYISQHHSCPGTDTLLIPTIAL
jgi:hypothetical protein